MTSVRAPVLSGMIALMLLIGGFGLWSTQVRITGAVIAAGVVEGADGRQIVQSPGGGIVTEILVREGDMVPAGAPLIRLDDRDLVTEKSIVEGQHAEVLARRGRLEAERDGTAAIRFPEVLLGMAATRPDLVPLLDGQQRLLAARLASRERKRAGLKDQLDQTEAQAEGVRAQTHATDRQMALISAELETQKILRDKGLAASATLLALEREQARLDGQSGELAARRAELAARAGEITLEVARLDDALREAAEAELRELGYRELELGERLHRLTDQIAAQVLRAPVAGRVHALQVTTQGAVLRPAETALWVVPQDRPLRIAARVAPADIDVIRPGQSVTLRFPGLSSGPVPDLSGRVARVPADAMVDPAGAAYFRIEVELDADAATRLGVPLVPGMPVEALFQTSERTPLVWLLQPITAYFGRAMRDG